MTRPPTGDRSVEHLLGRLLVLELRVRAAVERRRAADPDPDDRFRGLYVSEVQVDRLLDGPAPPDGPSDPDLPVRAAAVEAAADAAEADGADLRLRRLRRSFGLDELDLELLLVSLAPDVDARFERLYGYLNDDVSRRRASVALALELATGSPFAGRARERLRPGNRLVDGGLLVVEDADRPFLTRALRVPDRVTSHLLGDDRPDPAVAALLSDGILHAEPDGGPAALVRGLGEPGVLAYVQEALGASGTQAAASALHGAGLSALVLDLQRLDPRTDVRDVAPVAGREALLLGAGLVAGPVEAVADRPPDVRSFADLPCTVVLVGARGWEPSWSRRVPLLVEASPLAAAERAAAWSSELAGSPAAADDAVTGFRLTRAQVSRAVEAARRRAAAAGHDLAAEDLLDGARAQNAAGLERLARRVHPRVGWDDLVLPAPAAAQLRELAARARHRDRVLDEWGLGAGSSRGRGITALFAGDSGTGKTMSAEVVAADLGLDLYVIDLSSVVDKYVGETEKNLDRIFGEADRVNGVLLFDEADALFGKRSEVHDAHDRYANVEVAYLLQRMERFDGLAVLTTNLRANVDEAFTRRLDAIVDFPMPEQGDRRRMWCAHLRPGLPLGEDLDVDFLADAFKLSGGNIRNIVVTAAYLAAADGRPVGMADLIRGTQTEYRKLGRMCVPSEFGPYHRLLT